MNEMNLLTRFRAEVPLRISPHAEGPFDAGIHDHSAERSAVRPSRALVARVPMRVPWRQGSAQTPRSSKRTSPDRPVARGGYLTRPVSPAGPICVVDPAFVVDPGNWGCPNPPLKTNPPR
jgi:hypothetical protein